jgi:hypothetical protein
VDTIFDIIRIDTNTYFVGGCRIDRDAPNLWALRVRAESQTARPMFTAPTLDAMFDMVDGARRMMAPA